MSVFFAVQQPGLRNCLGPVFPSPLAVLPWRAGEEAAAARRVPGCGWRQGRPERPGPGLARRPRRLPLPGVRSSAGGRALGGTQPPPCRLFLRGFAGGISELPPAGSTSAGRKRSARVTSIFLHKQLAVNKHLKRRLRKPSARRAPLTGGAVWGVGQDGKVRGQGRKGVGDCAGRCPNTRSPSSEALLKLPTKSGPIPGEVTDRPVTRRPFPRLGSARAAGSQYSLPRHQMPFETRIPGASASAGRSHFAPVGPDTTDS